jgi:hypothetical protein
VPYNDWWVVDITELTKDWIGGVYPNYGVKISGQSNSGNRLKHFYTSDELTHIALRPKMVLTLINHFPESPEDMRVNSLLNPNSLTTLSPVFTARYVDEDDGDKANAYRIQIDDNSDFSSPVWDSGQTLMATTTEGSVSPNINYSGNQLTFDTQYYWRIKFWDDGGAEGAFSTESATFILSRATTTETLIVQPGPTEGKDTYYGTTYKTTGAPDFYRMEIGGWGDWYHSYIQMDLGLLPPESSKILDASLQLYNYQLSGTANNGKIERITQSWTESGVNSSSNPAATSTGMSWQSVPFDDWWVVDVTNLTKSWIDETYPNYGVKISGQYNSGCCVPQKTFYSSDEMTNVSLRPKMVFEIVNTLPDSPDSLLVSSQVNPTGLIETPTFSALFNDYDSGEQMGYYRIQVDNDSDFSSPVWDSQKLSMADINEGDRSEEIVYSGTALASNTQYYWRIKFWDDGGAEGAFSTEIATFTLQ